MKIYFFLLILFIIVFSCEFDRHYYINQSFRNYYFKDPFFKNICTGLYNAYNRTFYENSYYIYSVHSLNFDKYLKNNKEKLKKNFLIFYENNKKNKRIKNFNKISNVFGKTNEYYYIFFRFSGEDLSENINEFPIIKNILKNENIKTCFISIMNKEISIPYHKSPHTFYLRYHFPIIFDSNSDCYLEVMGKKLYYKNGSFMFDDSFPHKLEKKDNTFRAVLICDIKKDRKDILLDTMYKIIVNNMDEYTDKIK